jgi:hypothetical protein
MDRLDPHWVNWVNRQNGWSETVDAVLASGGLFRIFARNLQNMTADYRLGLAGAFIQLVDAEKLTRAAARTPVAALTSCTAGLALSNHLGNISEAGKWVRLGENFLPEARKADLDACVDFLNNRFVLSHNRYHFDATLSPEIEELLGILRQRQKLLADAGCRIDRKLGELLGTIAQNFGFCGPPQHKEFLAILGDAKEAFGRGDFADTVPDFLRLVGYSVYAYLDAGRRDWAREALSLYTGTDNMEQLLQKVKQQELSAWQQAAVARFLAYPGDEETAEAYLDTVQDTALKMTRDEHPWQLWLNNLGRIAIANRLPTSARRMFEESLRLCRIGKLGPTVRLMALMPLSGLRLLECLPEDMGEIEKEIRRAAEVIDSERFNLLLESPLVKALEPVWWKPEVLFPFTYR